MFEGKQTTGATISRLGVLTVLAHNAIEGNHLAADRRRDVQKEIRAILEGKRGVESEKVAVRSAERCAAGGMLIAVNGVGIYGTN
jgi:hypothetical protein